jgi:hypothetical protein
MSPPVEIASMPVRVISVTLETAEHGALDVRMSLKGRSLALSFRTERSETADRLRNDSAALTDMLQTQGYDASVVRIEARHTLSPSADFVRQDAQGGMGAGGNGLAGQAGGQRQSDMQEQRPRAVPPQDFFDTPARTRSDDSPSSSRGARGLYI